MSREFDLSSAPRANRYIAHEDPAFNPNRNLFSIEPNPIDIDKPFRLPHPDLANRNVADFAWEQRDLSGLPSEISGQFSFWFSSNVHNTPQFQAARKAYKQKYRSDKDRSAFKANELKLLREFNIQYWMRKVGIDRATAVNIYDEPECCLRGLGIPLAPSEDPFASVDASADVMKQEYQAIEQQEHMKFQCEQIDLQKREAESSQEREEEGEGEEEKEDEHRPLTRQQRTEILARDPWLAQEWDEKYGIGRWEPIAGFGTGCIQSYELYRREFLMAQAREKHPWKLPRMQAHKFDDRFPHAFDPEEHLRPLKLSGWRLRCPGLNRFRLWLRRGCRRSRWSVAC